MCTGGQKCKLSHTEHPPADTLFYSRCLEHGRLCGWIRRGGVKCSTLRGSVWASVGEVRKQRAGRPGCQEQSLCGNAGLGNEVGDFAGNYDL